MEATNTFNPANYNDLIVKCLLQLARNICYKTHNCSSYRITNIIRTADV